MNKKLLLIPVLLVLCVAFVNASSNLTNGAVVCYNFEENGGTILEDGFNNLNGTITNGGNYTWTTDSKVGTYAQNITTNGSTSGSGLADNAILKTDALTYAFWANVENCNSGSQDWPVMKWEGGTDAGYYTALSGGNLLFRFARAGQDVDFASITCEENVWRHYIVSFNESFDANLWVDGVLNVTDTSSYSGVLGHTTRPLGIGWDKSAGGSSMAGAIDSYMQWNRGFNQTDVDALYNSGASLDCSLDPGTVPQTNVEYVVSVNETETTSFYFNISYSNMTNATATLNYNGSDFNATTIFSNSSLISFQQNVTVPLIKINNSDFDFYWNYTVTLSNSSIDNYGGDVLNQTVYWTYFPTNLVAPDGVISQSVNFSFDVTNVSGLISTSIDKIELNGTNYSTTQSGDTRTTTIILPASVAGLSEVFTVNYYTNITYNGISYLRSSSTTQTTSSASLYDCSTSSAITNATTLNISLYDEDTLAAVTGSMELSFLYTPNGSTTTTNSSFSFSGANNYALCIYPEDGVFSLDTGYFEYSATGYDDRIYYLLNAQLTNTTLDLNLYLINSTQPSDVSFYVLDNLGNPVSGAYIDVQRYYPGNATYYVVETVVTDTNGLAVASIILNDITYKFNVDYDGTTIYTTSGSPVYATTLYFYVTFTNPANTISFDENSISYYVTYSNATDLFSFFFNDGDNTVTQGCLEVYQVSTSGESQLSNNCVNSSSATITYLLNQSTGTFVGRGYVIVSDNQIFLAEAYAIIGGLYKSIGGYGTLLSIIVTGTLAFAGIFMAEAVVIMALLGLIASYFMGLTFLTYQMLILLLIMGGLILFRKNK